MLSALFPSPSGPSILLMARQPTHNAVYQGVSCPWSSSSSIKPMTCIHPTLILDASHIDRHLESLPLYVRIVKFSYVTLTTHRANIPRSSLHQVFTLPISGRYADSSLPASKLKYRRHAPTPALTPSTSHHSNAKFLPICRSASMMIQTRPEASSRYVAPEEVDKSPHQHRQPRPPHVQQAPTPTTRSKTAPYRPAR